MDAAPYPVSFEVDRPARFDRRHVFLRLGILVVLGFVGVSMGWIVGLLYWLLPVAAAVLIARKDTRRFLYEDGPKLAGALHQILAFTAYMTFLTDELPQRGPRATVHFDVQPEGSPTLGSALLRLVFALPSAIVLVLLGVVSCVLWIVCAVLIVLRESVPSEFYRYQRGYVRWMARWMAYHASLVEVYPPFVLDMEPHAGTPDRSSDRTSPDDESITVT